jgi:hypothetical protein
MRREPRLNHLRAGPGRVDVLADGRTVVLGHDHADVVARRRQIRIQHLGVPHRDPSPGHTAGQPDAWYTNDVLAEVVDEDTATYFLHGPGRERLVDAGRITDLSDQRLPVVAEWRRRPPQEPDVVTDECRAFEGNDRGGCPASIVVGGSAPAVDEWFARGIVDLAHVEAAVPQRPLAEIAPSVVADDGVGRPIGIGHDEFRE